MNKKVNILQVRINNDMRHWFDVLESKYNIKKCNFVRDTIIEKMKKDVPKLRLIKESDKNKCPF